MRRANADIARQCFQAFADSDRALLETIIADDFHFSSPYDNRLNRAAYFERCWPNNEFITGFDFIRVIEAGDDVIVTYEGKSARGRTFRNTECLSIRDGQIVEVEVYFGWSIPHEAEDGGFINP